MMFHLGSILWIILIGIVVYLVFARQADDGCRCTRDHNGKKHDTSHNDNLPKKLGM